MEQDFLYHFPIPSVGEDGAGREFHEFVGMPAHEAVHEDWSKSSSMRVRLQEAVESRELPPAYFDHPLVRTVGALSFCFAAGFVYRRSFIQPG